MPWYLVTFCWLVVKLDRIPRYGRYFTAERRPEGETPRIVWKGPHWQYTKRGFWGFNILIRMKLFWKYEAYLRFKAGKEVNPDD